MNRFPVLLLFLCFLSLEGQGQQLSNQRKRAIALQSKGDTVMLDTLSIIPGSFHFTMMRIVIDSNATSHLSENEQIILNRGNRDSLQHENDTSVPAFADTFRVVYGPPKITKYPVVLDSTYYTVLPEEGKIVLNRKKLKSAGINADSIFCSYKVFPYLFSKTLQHKDNSIVHPTLYNNQSAYVYQVGPNANSNDPFDLGTLSKSGSISRGISFGNNQNMNVNSSLNLQLAGKLTNNVNVQVAATDNSLPIQPEGNTAQLQDFDKVFVRIYDKHNSLVAGDFELGSPNDYFMKFYKKSQGGLFTTSFMTKYNKDTNKAGIMKVTVAGGISKGKFAENKITPIDGNMGPYRLTGTDNENFIVVLSGTEKVYLDGQLLQRGQNNDYTIDYNAAQLIFTPKHLITATSIIVVDFQYSDLSYVRSLIHTSTEYHQDKLSLRFNIYSEQDAKHQPLSQSLTAEQEQFLGSVGNNIQNAIAPGAVVTPFNSTLVLYRRVVDTVFNNDTVYVYSTDSLLTLYNVSFSQVTQGQGDYIQIQSAANGRVFQWKAPVNGIHQGNFIPNVLLITPKKKQMLTFGGDYRLAKNTSIFAEGAITNNDVNTFSNFGKSQDAGYAGKVLLHNVAYFKDSTKENKGNVWRLQSDISYEGVQKDFSPIERYRTVDFDRSWNRTSDSIYDNQQILDGNFIFGNRKDQVGYDFQSFLEGANYAATKQTATLKSNEGGFMTNINGSLLQTKSTESTSTYYKELAIVSHKLFFWIAGVGQSTEKDLFKSRRTDSIIETNSALFEQANNYQFYQWSVFIKTPDTAKRSYGINYSERTDYGADISKNEMVKSLFTKNISMDAAFVKNPKSRFKANLTYHIMQVLADSAITSGQTPVNALVGQAEYDATILKGLIYSSTYYQAGSGLQPKEEYTYIQVAQGTGVYAWTDYNHDGIKQLNEFYTAPFPDEADYIRVYLPTTNYEKTYTNSFTETFNLRPSALWGSKKGIRKFVSLFSEQLAFHADRKTTSSSFWNAYNPFIQNTGDTNLIGLNTSLRNTVYFNQLNPHFGMDFTYSDTRNKTILEEDGAQSRIAIYQDLHARLALSTKWIVEAEGKKGYDVSYSQFFATNNYYVTYYQLQPKLSFQPNTSFRTTLLFVYSDKVNAISEGGGSSQQENSGLELKYNIITKGSLTANFNFIRIGFNGDASSPLGLEILQGLRVGNNYTWGISYLCNLSGNIQLNLSYTGRASEGSPVVNTGNASVRAFF